MKDYYFSKSLPKKILSVSAGLLFFTFSHLTASSLLAQERVYSIDSIAGKIWVSSVFGYDDCFIKLKGNLIHKFECEYSPEVLKHFKQQIQPFDEVIVFEERTISLACTKSSVFFLGINKDGAYEFSEPVPYCGDSEPIVVLDKDKIKVTLPAFKAFRGGWIGKEVWVYQNGTVSQVKEPKTKSRSRKSNKKSNKPK